MMSEGEVRSLRTLLENAAVRCARRSGWRRIWERFIAEADALGNVLGEPNSAEWWDRLPSYDGRIGRIVHGGRV